MAERDRIKADSQGANLLCAYNVAVSTKLDKLKREEPLEFQKLQDTLSELKEQAKLGFIDQTESVQAA